MKKIFLLSFLIFAGCAAVSPFLDAQKRCANDPGCVAEVNSYANVGKVVASPWGKIAENSAGTIITFAGLAILGFKLKKKEEGK